jgi:hypothetical protein
MGSGNGSHQVRNSFLSRCSLPHLSIADISAVLLQRWATPIFPLPELKTLISYIQEPLAENAKIPLPDHAMRDLSSPLVSLRAICHINDVQLLFRSSEDEQADLLWTITKAGLTFDPPDDDSTESAFHQFWDGNIRRILDITTKGKCIRDSNNQTSTALLRPDFGVLVNGICAFRGEEKAPRYSGTHPKDELINKLTWTYDPAPYVLG